MLKPRYGLLLRLLTGVGVVVVEVEVEVGVEELLATAFDATELPIFDSALDDLATDEDGVLLLCEGWTTVPLEPEKRLGSRFESALAGKLFDLSASLAATAAL